VSILSLCFSEYYINHEDYLYDTSEVGWVEGGWVVIDVRDVYVDHHGGGHGWDSTVQSSDGQRVAGNLEGQTQRIYIL